MAPRPSTATTKSKKEQDIVNLASQVARKEAKKVANRISLSPDYEEGMNDEDDDDTGLATISFDTLGDHKTSNEVDGVATGDQVVQDNELRDVFEIGNEVMKTEGVPIKYYIKRNGSLAGTEKAPYSVEQLQEKYGSGEYLIQAKKSTNGKFVKQQSMSLDAPLVPEKGMSHQSGGHSSENLMNSFEAILSSTQEQTKDTVDKLLAIQREREEKEERRRQEDREREEKRLSEEREKLKMETNSQTQLFSTILTALKPQPDNSSAQVLQMVQESNRMFMEGLNKVAENTNRMFEKLMDKQERDNEKAERKRDDDRRDLLAVIEKLKEQQNNSPKQDPLEMVKFLRDAQREALEDYQERKALIREEIEEMRGSNEKPEPKSLTDKVIENLAPLLMMGAQMKSQQPPQFAPQQMAPAQDHGQTHVVKPNPSLKKITTATTRPVVQGKVATATVKPVVKAQSAPTPAQATVAPKNTVESNPEASKINQEVTLKGQIITYAGNILGEGIISLQTPTPISAQQTAQKVAEGLVQGGLTVAKAVEVVRYEDIDEEAFVKNSLPRMAVLENYLKDFYETLLNIAQAELGNTTTGQGANP